MSKSVTAITQTLNAPQPTIPLPRGPVPQAPPEHERRSIEIKIDDRTVSVPEGSTILDAAKKLGIDTPTLCFLESLTPVNVCRVCVVELEGSRTLVPACSRKVEPNMSIKTDSERVRLSRRLVLEFLASSVDLSTAPAMHEYMVRYGAHPERFGDAHATVAQPVKIDNDLYVRDYSKCVLCYKCVEACGVDAQNTFAIAVAAAVFPRISPRSLTSLCPTRHASIAATASVFVPPGRSCSRANMTCARRAPGTKHANRRRTLFVLIAAWAAISRFMSRTAGLSA